MQGLWPNNKSRRVSDISKISKVSKISRVSKIYAHGTRYSENPLPDPVHGVGGGDPINGLHLTGTPIRVGVSIAKGCFGEVRMARNWKTNEILAVKLERVGAKKAYLQNEWEIYQALNKTPAAGIPKAFYFSTCGLYNALAMELLGPSLQQVFDMCGHKFKEQTVLKIATQLIVRLQFLHEKHIVHQDINPANLLISRHTERDDTIFIVDFGLSKYYIDQVNQSHISYAEYERKSGGTNYMSLRSHMGVEQSRRDDLESLGYVLIYFLLGHLPWEDLSKEHGDVHNQLVFNMKKSVNFAELCRGRPPEFAKYMQYVAKLRFKEAPDYNYLRHMFQVRLENVGYDPMGSMEWNSSVATKTH